MPSISPDSLSLLVTFISSSEGLGLPDGWLCIREDNNEILAVGNEAREMMGRTPENILAIQPVKEGVISDFEATQAMMSYFIQKGSKGLVSPRIIVCVPYGITKVERKAIEEAAMQSGGREIFILDEPISSLIISAVLVPITMLYSLLT